MSSQIERPAQERLVLLKERLGQVRADTPTDELAELIDDMTGLRSVLAGALFKPLLAELALRTGFGRDRVEELLRLPTKLDLRRALRARTQPGAIEEMRLPGEEVYPTDGWLGDYLRYSRGDEAPLGFHFWTAVAVLGAACRRNIYIDMNIFEVFGNTYTCLVGPPATKKSQAINQGLDILSRANHLMETSQDPVFQEHEYFNVLPNKCTPEAVVEALVTKDTSHGNNSYMVAERTESHGVWLTDEGVSLLGKSTYNPSGHIEQWTDWYSCPRNPKKRTVGKGLVQLFNVSITLVLGSTPDWIRTGITDEMFQGGFVSRCTFVYRDRPKRLFPVPDIHDPVERDRLAARLLPLIHLRDKIIAGSQEFWDYHHDWYLHEYEAQSHLVDEHRLAWRARRQIHALKLAMLLAISNGRFVVELKDFTRAVSILEAEERGVQTVIDVMGGHEDLVFGDHVMRILKKAGGWMSRSNLTTAAKHKIGNAANLNRVLSSLITEGLVGQRHRGTALEYYLIKERGATDPEFEG